MGPVVKLIFGVLDLPYADADSYGKRKPKHVPKGAVTTGDVATILEEQYGIFDVFWEKHGDQIGADLLESIEGSLETALMGGPVSGDPFASASAKAEQMFKDFLSTQEVERVGLLGVPTRAALEGHSKRRKRPYAKGKRRPSFIDTGLYQSSAKVWVED